MARHGLGAASQGPIVNTKGWHMRRTACLTLVLCQLLACNGRTVDQAAEQSMLAERFFRGVYGCNPSVVSTLAADSVLISYPIFTELFDTPAIRGRSKVEAFASGFCSRWQDAQITIHEAIADADRVVLVWGFRAREVASGAPHSWGGISLFRFDDAGRIVAEIGEESEPGPIERVSASPDST